jgi:hypothetical protein
MNEDTSVTLVLADGTTINVLADGTVLTSMPDNGGTDVAAASVYGAAASVSKWQTPVPMADWTALLGGGRGRNHPSTPRPPPPPPHTHVHTLSPSSGCAGGWGVSHAPTFLRTYPLNHIRQPCLVFFTPVHTLCSTLCLSFPFIRPEYESALLDAHRDYQGDLRHLQGQV